MADTQPSDAAARSEDIKIREEWRRLERERLDEEIAEARQDAETIAPQRRGPAWLTWVALAVALAGGIAVAVLINSRFDFRR